MPDVSEQDYFEQFAGDTEDEILEPTELYLNLTEEQLAELRELWERSYLRNQHQLWIEKSSKA